MSSTKNQTPSKYLHAKHVGNAGDVLKHVILSTWLDALQTDSNIRFMDTHAGAGLYELNQLNDYAAYKNGIDRVWQHPSLASCLLDYKNMIASFQSSTEKSQTLTHYPGSPNIARAILKNHSLDLCEWSPQIADQLKSLFTEDDRVTIWQNDGFNTAKQVSNENPSRYAVLMDPPYENPAEFEQAIETLLHCYQQQPEWSFLIWYPVYSLSPLWQKTVQQRLQNHIKQPIWRLESWQENKAEQACRMIGSGLLLVNPSENLKPVLEEQLSALTALLYGRHGKKRFVEIVT